MNITFNDISRRMRSRNNIECSKSIEPRLYTIHNEFCSFNAINAITHWDLLGENSNEAYNKALDIFEEVCDNENKSIIGTCLSILIENIDKVRDATQLMNSLKYRAARMKRKVTTKVNKGHNKTAEAINDKINKLSTIPKGGIGKLPDTGINSSSDDSEKDDAVEEAFNELIYEANKCKECDRIIENYAKISKRFNIDKIISEVTMPNDMYHAIISIARCMDTFNMPFKNKYCHTLEAAYYAINNSNINYPSEDIIEAVTDYFIFNSYLTEDDIESIKQIKDISVVYESGDFDKISYLYENDIDNNEEDYNIDIDTNELIESYCFEGEFKKDIKAKKKEIKKAARDLKRDAKKGNPEERIDRSAQREISNFRKQCAKDPDNKNNLARLKSMVTSIYAKSPYQIVYGLPNLFAIVRTSFVLLGTAIHPAIGVIQLITNYIIKMALSRKQTEKVVKAYQNEIDSVREKLDKADDEETKDHLQKYLDELNKDYEKIKTYENNLYSEEENDERDTSTEYNKYDSLSVDDDFFDLDDDEWDDYDLKEAASIIYIANLMESINEGLIDGNVEGIIYKNLYKLDNDSIDSMTDFCITVPIILEKDKMRKALEDYRTELRESESKDYMRIDCLNENIAKLNRDSTVYDTTNNLSDIGCYLTCLNEIVNMNACEEYVMELKFTNTLKLAVDRLKKNAVKLKDKDKQISNTIDVSINNISKGIETALMNENREAVIKGRILPSASKCIKIACVLGATWVVNPAVAVIAAVGGFAMSQKLKAKERKLVLDDIEIELKMVERYIKQAEDKDDLKKVRQLEIIQRSLQRQKQRLKYKMHVEYRQGTISVPENNN